MAKDSFKVKKSLNIKPTDPSTLTNREAGDIIVDSTDNNKLKTYNPSSDTYQSVSTPGGLDTVFVENLESNTSSSFTTGQNATPDAAGTGTLGGVVSDETSSQISGERSLKYTMNATAASSNNDFFLNDTDIVLDAKHKGNFIGISFYYTYDGADNDIRFFVLDQDDNEITQSDEYIKANTNPTRFSTSVFVPSDDTALRYGFQVVTGNSSKVFIVDDIEFSTNPFVYKNLASENVYSARIANNGTASITSQSADFIASVNRASVGRVDITFESGFFSEVPAIVAVINNLDGTVNGMSTANETTSGVRVVADVGGVLSDKDFSIVVQKQGADYQAPAEHVVTPAKAAVEYFSCSSITSNFWDSTASNPGFDTSLVPLTNSQYLEYDDTTQTRIQAKKACIVTYTATGRQNDNVSIHAIKSDGSYLSWVYAQANNEWNTISGTVELEVGEYFYFNRGVASSREGGITLEARPKEATFLAAVPVPLVAKITGEKPSGTEGGTFTSGAWQTRELTNTYGDTSFVSLSSNQFTLPKGKYIIEASAPVYRVQRHRTAIYNVTDSTYEAYGTTEIAWDGDTTGNRSFVETVIDISATKTFELRHRCSLTKTTDGFGKAASFGVNEVHATVKITKIK